jgi:hypothetical protein
MSGSRAAERTTADPTGPRGGDPRQMADVPQDAGRHRRCIPPAPPDGRTERTEMSPFEIVILLAMTGYAVYRQTQRHEVVGARRFRLAIIYGVVGLVVGGLHAPDTVGETLLLVASIGLSVAVGLARGRLTRLWPEDGRVYAQGTAVTIGLFVGMVVVKFAMGTAAYFLDISDDGGFGEVLLMIAVMVAFQAELVWRRARALGARATTTSGATA